MGIAKNKSNQGISKSSVGVALKSEGKSSAIPGSSIDVPEELSKAERIWQIVASIPSGQVASYGQIATLAGLPGYARFVGTTLGKLPQNTSLPWHRVVNASLHIAPRNSDRMREQKRRLRQEGVTFTGDRVIRACHWQT
ncbi:MAG: cysteine methyltransferase [Proteobacteria bacterium]|nr:cysteine methyltransferase [Pseudomonadota bacterium]